MSNNLVCHTVEAVHVKVKKCEPNAPTEWRKFSIDPQITNLKNLYPHLAKAFEIKSDFSIKYKAYDPAGNEIYLSILSDWDLDAAFLRAHNLSIQTSSEPCLMLQLDVKPFTEFKEWESMDGSTLMPNAAVSGSLNMTARDIISPLQQSLGASQKYMQQMHNKLPGMIMNQMEKTFSMVQKAFNLSEETMATLPPRPPLSDSEFRLFLDALGQIQRSDELRKVIFFGGIDPSLRRVVWKHILNVYPSGMNGNQRMDYMRCKSEHYYKLRNIWMEAVKEGGVMGELAYVTSMVKKDVLRTDRLHTFYAGNDDNQNVTSLFNILTTYALNHPSVSYCQGMSDIASPLLVTMNDEAQAYICFCAIMKRVRGNFMLDGIAMTRKFAHLTEALSYYDPEFWNYLKLQQADDLLFCYRWLLLELKREFPFEDSLRMLEVQWSSLKYDSHLDEELQLYEREFILNSVEEMPQVLTSPTMNAKQKGLPLSSSYRIENAYTKICALRRQNSSSSLTSLNCNHMNGNHSQQCNQLYLTKRLNQSLDDKIPQSVSMAYKRIEAKAYQSLDEMKIPHILKENKNGEQIQTQPLITTTKSSDMDVNDNDDDDDDDDDVFIEESQFKFHDTNPFKNDALTNQQPLYRDSVGNRSLPKAFLSSSSSSIISENSISDNGIENATDVSNGGGSVAIVSDNKNDSCKVPQSIAKLQNKNILSNYNAVSNIIAKQLAHASSVGESVKRVGCTGGNHFKDLKEKIAATSRRGLLQEISNDNRENQIKPKLVRNFNEFLNFATVTKKPSMSLENSMSLVRSATTEKSNILISPVDSGGDDPPLIIHPLTQLTKEDLHNSLDDSDSMSLPDNSWSTTAATTIQQHQQHFSNNSLQLELNPFASSETHTPESTSVPEECIKILPTPTDTSCSIPTAKDHFDYRNLQSLDNHIFNDNGRNEVEYKELGKDSLDLTDEPLTSFDTQLMSHLQENCKQQQQQQQRIEKANDMASEDVHCISNKSLQTSYSSSILMVNDLPEVLIPISADTEPDNCAELAQEEVTFTSSTEQEQQEEEEQQQQQSHINTQLPPPAELGDGNPFLIFLCLTLLLQHRNTIMRAHMDYNEIAMHFDKMVRRHDVTRVLNQARRMYVDYLKIQATYKQQQQ